MMKFFLFLIIAIIAFMILRRIPRLLRFFNSAGNTPPRKVNNTAKYDKSKVVDADFEELK